MDWSLFLSVYVWGFLPALGFLAFDGVDRGILARDDFDDAVLSIATFLLASTLWPIFLMTALCRRLANKEVI